MSPFRTIICLSMAGLGVALLLGCSEAAKQEPPEEGNVSTLGASLYTKAMGSGLPVIVVHGGPGLDHSYFLPHLERLSESYRLHFYDQRASGRSTAGDSAAFTLAQFVADLDSVRVASDHDKVHVLAHSWGSILALNYAISHTEHVASLVLVNPIAASTSLQQGAAIRLQQRITPADSVAKAELMASSAFQRRDPDALQSFFRLNFRPSFYKPERVSTLNFGFDEHFASRSSMLRLLGGDNAFTSYDLHSKLEGLAIPVQVVFGIHDAIGVDELAPMLNALPNSRLVRMDSSGHFPFVEEPARFTEHVTAFLGSISE